MFSLLPTENVVWLLENQMFCLLKNDLSYLLKDVYSVCIGRCSTLVLSVADATGCGC